MSNPSNTGIVHTLNEYSTFKQGIPELTVIPPPEFSSDVIQAGR